MVAIASVLVLAALLGYFSWVRARTRAEVTTDTSPVLDEWVITALEDELARTVFAWTNASEQERAPLERSLRGNPDPAIVSAVEAAVDRVELEFVRYAHESDVEASVRVRYEDGRTGSATRRLAWDDVPPSVRHDFDHRASTRVFRAWAFPWSRAHVQ